MPSPTTYFGHLVITRFLLQRGMAAIYFIAFLTGLLQGKPLIGTQGLIPIPDFVKDTPFQKAPSLFQWGFSDRLLDLVSWTGLLLSSSALLGLMEGAPCGFL